MFIELKRAIIISYYVLYHQINFFKDSRENELLVRQNFIKLLKNHQVNLIIIENNL